MLELIGFDDPGRRSAVRGRLYAAIRDLYAATRERELIAQKDRSQAKRSGAPSVQELAAELWDEHVASLALLEFPRDFLAGGVRTEPFDLLPGEVEVGDAMLETGRRLRAGTIRVGGRNGTVLDVGGVGHARYLAAAAACGMRGELSVPADDGVCAEAADLFERHRRRLEAELEALVKQRVHNDRRAAAVHRALLRRALGWRREPR